MILKCITNWSSSSGMRSLPNNGEDMMATSCRQQQGPSPSPLNGIVLFDEEEDRRLGISPRDHPWDEVSLSTTKSSTEETTDSTEVSTLTGPPEQYYGNPTTKDPFQLDLDHAVSLASDTGAVTLMGPPKQYYGESAEDRYAYMLHEAISLLHKHGFSTNITTLRHQALQTSAVHNNKSTTKPKKQFHRVPGILGFLLNEMTSHTKIAIFEPEHDELVAYLGFMSYNQPWLKVCCRSYLPEHTQVIDLLQLILSKRFLIINIPHETKAALLELPKRRSTGSGKAEVGDSTLMMEDGNNLILKMTTAMAGKRREEEKLWTMFVVEKGGIPIAKALWSYACEGVDSAGPSMEMFETFKSSNSCDTSFVPAFLARMEDAMIHVFAPLVAFRLRFCYVDDYPDAARWLKQRGYVKNKQDKTYLHKAFVVF